MAGTITNRACYWTNWRGNLNIFGTINTNAASIFKAGNKLYISGNDLTGTPAYAFYLVDIKITFLPQCINSVIVKCFVSSNGDIHIGATSALTGILYWKNDILKYSIGSSNFNDLYVFNDNVYITGHIPGANPQAFYSKNGNDIYYLPDIGYEAIGNAIFVKKDN